MTDPIPQRPLIRAHSLTVTSGYIRTKVQGGGNATYIQEKNPDTKREEFEIWVDFANRVVTIVTVKTGDRNQIPFEGCNWRPYTEDEMLELETKPTGKKKAS